MGAQTLPRGKPHYRRQRRSQGCIGRRTQHRSQRARNASLPRDCVCRTACERDNNPDRRLQGIRRLYPRAGSRGRSKQPNFQMKALISFLFLSSVAALAQAPRVDTLVSPEVHSDRRVTFRVRASKASEVTLFGDWMTPDTKHAMIRDEQGVWTTTVGPLEPGLAIYTF